MLNFRQIEVFRAVMIAKTVSGAAELLNVSQPGLSRMLKHTEDKLGFALFDRSSGRLVPTKEANGLFKEVELIYKKIEGLEFQIKKLERGEDTVFQLGSSPSLGRYIIPKVLGKLNAKFENLIIQYDILSVQQIADYLLQERGEFAVGVFPVNHPNIYSKKFGSAPLVCVLPASHALANEEVVSLEKLSGHPLISFRADTPHGALISAAFLEAKTERVVTSYVRFAETACSLVRNGLGIAIVDGFTAMGEAGEGLVIRPITPSRNMSIYSYRNKFGSRSRFSKYFESELIKFIQAGSN
jgi:DNA-binding transcriptional LysR family regulator